MASRALVAGRAMLSSAVRTQMAPLCVAPTMMASRTMAIDARVVKFDSYGKPADVLSVVSETVPEDLKPSQVLVKMLAAPITVNDLARVKGYGSGGSGTGVPGSEGVARVVSTGKNVQGVAKGDLVVPAHFGVGTWRTHAIVAEEDIVKANVGDVPAELAAAAVVAPLTAERLVEDFADLAPGDVIIQNNAGSTVGQAVIQAAHARGIKTINILRHRNDWDDLVNHFNGLGATITVNDEFARSPDFAKLIADLPAPKLGLSSVGGSSSRTLARHIGTGGTLVAYGSMTSDPVSVSWASLVERDISIRGFNFAKWFAGLSPASQSDVVSKAITDASTEKSRILLAREPFEDFEHALQRAQTAGERKVVMVFP